MAAKLAKPLSISISIPYRCHSLYQKQEVVFWVFPKRLELGDTPPPQSLVTPKHWDDPGTNLMAGNLPQRQHRHVT